MSTEQTKVNENQDQATLPADDGMSFLDEQPMNNVANPQDNSGALYPNTQRRKESHPNCRGRSLIDGKWFWVSGWNNIMPSGNSRYISLAYTEMTQEDIAKYITKQDAQQATNEASTKAAQATAALNEDTEAQAGVKPEADEIF